MPNFVKRQGSALVGEYIARVRTVWPSTITTAEIPISRTVCSERRAVHSRTRYSGL